MLGITSGAPIIIYCGKYRAVLGIELGLARNFVKIFSRNFFIAESMDINMFLARMFMFDKIFAKVHI